MSSHRSHPTEHAGDCRYHTLLTPTRDLRSRPVPYQRLAPIWSHAGRIASISAVLATLLTTACQPAEFAKAEELIREQLKDPDSGQFKDWKRCGKSSIVSVRVNAKNSYGAYGGFEQYHVDGYTVEDGEGYGPLARRCHAETMASLTGKPASSFMKDDTTLTDELLADNLEAEATAAPSRPLASESAPAEQADLDGYEDDVAEYDANYEAAANAALANGIDP